MTLLPQLGCRAPMAHPAVKLAAAVPDWSHAPALSNLCLSPEAAWLSLLLQDAAYFEVRTEQL
jgi:hypothetical protein